MVLFKPIPLSILGDTVIWKAKSDSGGWGGDETDGITIKNVYFEPSHAVEKTNTDEEKLIKGLLVIDVVNSNPFETPAVGDTIIYQGTHLTVQSCDVIKSLHGQIHHLEVQLV